ncbi:MAG: CHAT domain-containing protein [Bacteroidia bacterium]|nr:CHAT domain-containing protein [Bacteroidia bacterium]
MLRLRFAYALLYWGGIIGAQTIREIDSLFQRGEYASAFRLCDSLCRQEDTPDTLRLYVSLKGSECLLQLHELYDAGNWLMRAESLAVKIADTLGWIKSLHGKARLSTEKAEYAEADSLFGLALGLCAYRAAEEGLYASLLGGLAMLRNYQSRYSEAESLFKATAAIQLRSLGENHPLYLITLHNLALTYEYRGKYAQAEEFYKEAARKRAQVLGEGHMDYLATAHNLGCLYVHMGKYSEAEALLQKVAYNSQQNLKEEHPFSCTVLHNLASLYIRQGRYKEAETLLNRVGMLRKKVVGERHPEYLTTLNNLALVLDFQARYTEAEKLYLMVAERRKETLGPRHSHYLTTLHNLAINYSAQGRRKEAIDIQNHLSAIKAEVLGNKHPDYINTLQILAGLYEEDKKYDQAESLYKEALRLLPDALGERHHYYFMTLGKLAGFYIRRAKYDQAEGILLRVLDQLREVIGERHPDYWMSVRELALLREQQGRLAEADSLYLQMVHHQIELLGERHTQSLSSMYRLALIRAKRQMYSQADSLWQKAVAIQFAYLRQEAWGLPESHKLRFLEKTLLPGMNEFQKYVGLRGRDNPALLRLGYRAGRSIKGLILVSSEGLRFLAEANPDSTVRQLYRIWSGLSTQYAMLNLQNRQREADSVEQVLVSTERALLQKLPEVGSFLPDPLHEPDPPLRKGEAVVEILRVPTQGDSVLYLFYLLFPAKQGVALSLYVHRVDERWEKQAERAFEILRTPGSQVSPVSYGLLWRFIDSLLPSGTNRVYISPDGVYHRVNIGALHDGSSFIIDRYEVRYTATSRRLILKHRKPSAAQKAFIIGNPSFHTVDVPGEGIRNLRLFESGIPPLPGAEEEAKKVAHLLNVKPIIGREATEEKLKRIKGPVILHIATHGYYFRGAGPEMLRSGLLLAGAAVWDSVYPPLNIEDGYLTAREVSVMNLWGTQLVVLSACETGLGEITREGLYGLQRAFLEAGAQRVIATLWVIDDQATQKLMLTFYKKLASKYDLSAVQDWGREVDSIFKEAIRRFRQKYAHPYYWGAFVVMR